eukprot:782641-Amorphochlora_amoeboformis.AAC.1
MIVWVRTIGWGGVGMTSVIRSGSLRVGFGSSWSRSSTVSRVCRQGARGVVVQAGLKHFGRSFGGRWRGIIQDIYIFLGRSSIEGRSSQGIGLEFGLGFEMDRVGSPERGRNRG